MKLKHLKQLSNLCMIGTLAIVLILAFKTISIKKNIRLIEDSIQQVEVDLMTNNSKLKSLEQELQQIHTIEYIEKIATEKLGLIKEDSILIREKDTKDSKGEK